MSNKNPKNLSSFAAQQSSTAASAATAVTEAAEREKAAAAEQAAETGLEGPEAAEEDSAPESAEGAVQEAPKAAEPAAEDAPIAGVIVASTPVARAPVARPVPGAGVVVSKSAAPTGGALNEKLEKILAGVPAAHQADITRIRLYCQAMAPGKPVAERVGATEQAALYRSIQNIINRQGEYFTPLFTALLAVFQGESSAALGDRYRNRFMEHVVLSKADRTALQQLTHLLSMIAVPGTRAVALKQVNLEKCLANGLTAEGQRRVLQYLNM